MGKSIEEMYSDLITEETLNEFLKDTGTSMSKYHTSDDDDDEVFMTSKEVVAEEKAREEKFGSSSINPNPDIEEELYFKTYSKKHVHKYTESEMNKIREECKMTIVHDYGENDIYHMSDEERAEVDMLSEMSMKLGMLKSTYRQVDQYIEAMRVVVQAWEILEEKANFVHSKEEFFTLVGQGRIVSGRILMPKLKRIGDYNMDLLIKYISNPELDPKDLLIPGQGVTKDSWYDQFDDIDEDPSYREYYDEYIELHKDDIKNDEDEDEDNDVDSDNEDDDEDDKIDEYELSLRADEYARDRMQQDELERLLSTDEVEYILQHVDHPEKIHLTEIPRKYVKDYDQNLISSKRKKKRGKKDRMIRSDVSDMLRRIQDNPENREDIEYSSSYLITNSMFDTSKPFKDFWDDLYFDGSWANSAQVHLYDLAVRQELLKQHPAKQKYLTYADQQLNEFFTIAESNGINTIELRRRMELSADGSASSKAVVKAKQKENRKIESAILQRITNLNDNPKFKKLVEKAENSLNKYFNE